MRSFLLKKVSAVAGIFQKKSLFTSESISNPLFENGQHRESALWTLLMAKVIDSDVTSVCLDAFRTEPRRCIVFASCRGGTPVALRGWVNWWWTGEWSKTFFSLDVGYAPANRNLLKFFWSNILFQFPCFTEFQPASLVFICFRSQFWYLVSIASLQTTFLRSLEKLPNWARMIEGSHDHWMIFFRIFDASQDVWYKCDSNFSAFTKGT